MAAALREQAKLWEEWDAQAQPAPADGGCLTVDEVIALPEFAGLLKSTLMRAHRLGQVSAVRIGARGVRFQVGDIRRFLASRKA